MKFAQMLSRGCRGLILAVLAFGAAGLGVAARAQESPPSFVDERRLPQSGPDAARQRQSQEALDKLKGESEKLRERLQAETEARRKAEQEAAARQAEENAAEAKRKAEEEATARKAAEEEAARQRAAEAERARQAAAAAAKRRAEEAAAARQRSQSRQDTRDAAGALAARMSTTQSCRDLRTSVEPRPAGVVEIKLQSACLAGQKVMLTYGDSESVHVAGQDGSLNLPVDLYQGLAPLSLTLPDGTKQQITLPRIDLSGISKVAVLWTSPVNLDLHALEYLAPRGGDGHVWAQSPGSIDQSMTASRDGARGRGFMSSIDDGRGEGMHAEVYTFLHNKSQRSGAITLIIDYETRGDTPSGEYCGNGSLAAVEAVVIRMRPGGRIEKENVRLSSAPCGEKLPEAKRFNSDTLSDLVARG